jgi:glycerol kinase
MADPIYLCALDQGTTGTTALLVDVSNSRSPVIVGKHTVDFKQHYPQAGWVEHDLGEVWDSVDQAIAGACTAAEAARGGFRKEHIVGIGITNQRETICLFDRKTGEPVHRAIVWQCKRSSAICERLKKSGVEAKIKSATGLVLDPYFSGTKIAWLMENMPEIASSIREKKTLVGTVDAWLVYRLSGGKSFATEASNASRTLLFNINTGCWDRDLLATMGLPSEDVLPVLKDSAGIFGKTSGLKCLPDGIPISGILGDQQAALAGQACFSVGLGKCTYGTGAFLLVNQGDKPILSKNGLLTTVAWSLGGKLTYAFEGSAFIAGASIQFLRDQLGIIRTAGETESLAASATAAPDVYFVPALAGLGAPDWDHQARGAFLGLTRGTTNAQIVRAALEGIVFQVCDLMTAIAADLGRPITTLHVDGGACANSLLMQIQANIGNLDVERPCNLETTAFGAAMMAGLGIGIYKNLNDLSHARQVDQTFRPQLSKTMDDDRARMLAGWRRAKNAVQVFAGTAVVSSHD